MLAFRQYLTHGTDSREIKKIEEGHYVVSQPNRINPHVRRFIKKRSV
jgi:hypothetical protein